LPKKRRRILILALSVTVLFAVTLRPIAKTLFPDRFRDHVKAYAREFDLPETLVNAVIWCESRFRPDAVSSAGACGLMQLAPATFKELTEELGLPIHCDIFSPDANVRCGVLYLKKLLTLFPEESTALAAYNAGMGRVEAWLADPRYSHDGKTLHTIPFPETAFYVKKVLAVKNVYEKLYP
jgi:soluble lytic murein transglycosylase